MAIFSITKPFNCRVFKLRLPRRLRSKTNTASPPPETTSPGVGDGDGGPGTETTKITTSTKEDEFRQVFRFLDANNDGKISVEELRAYFGSVGESLSHDEAEKIIREFSKGGGDDEDSNLLLEFGEFVRVMELRDGVDDGDKVLRQAFEVYEVEKGSGCITAEGLRVVLRRLGDAKSVEECKAMIRVYDLDGNGVLDFHEFHKMMT